MKFNDVELYQNRLDGRHCGWAGLGGEFKKKINLLKKMNFANVLNTYDKIIFINSLLTFCI